MQAKNSLSIQQALTSSAPVKPDIRMVWYLDHSHQTYKHTHKERKPRATFLASALQAGTAPDIAPICNTSWRKVVLIFLLSLSLWSVLPEYKEHPVQIFLWQPVLTYAQLKMPEHLPFPFFLVTCTRDFSNSKWSIRHHEVYTAIVVLGTSVTLSFSCPDLVHNLLDTGKCAWCWNAI